MKVKEESEKAGLKLSTQTMKIILVFWERCMQVKKQKLETDMEEQNGSNLEKEIIKAVYCHLAYLTSVESTSCEMSGWMKHKLK